MRRIVFLLSILGAPTGSVAQVSQAPLQTFISGGGVTGTFHPATGIPTHFSSFGQPMVLARPASTNNGGGVMNSNELMFSIVDSSPPAPGSNRTLESIPPNTSLGIDADFSDPESGVFEVLVQYRPVSAAGTVPIEATLIKGPGISWTGSIPASAVTELGVEYRFKIKNGVNLQYTSPQLMKVVVSHGTTGLKVDLNTTFSKKQESYRIIAIPLVLSSKTVNDVFSQEFDQYNENVWRMYHYGNGNMNKLSSSSIIEPGKGYWFISTQAPTGEINTGAGFTVPASSEEPFEITLTTGWNQIGNPYNFDISWNDVLAANASLATKLGPTARSYNGAQIPVDEIKKFEGAYVSFTGSAPDNKIKIPVGRNPSINGRTKRTETTNSLSSDYWEVRLNLSNGIQQYSFGGIGMHPGANEHVDEFDDFNIPRFFEYLEVNHPKKVADMSFTKDVVPTQPKYVWNFTTESNQPGALSLQWDNSYFGNGEEQLWLLDVETGQAWDMRKENRVSADFKEVRRWRVAYGSREFVSEATLPEASSLISVSPNPFKSQVEVEFAIVRPSFVKLEVLDINGRTIKTLLDGTMEKGRHVVTWSGGGHGVDAPSGLYLVRLQADGVQYKRMVKN